MLISSAQKIERILFNYRENHNSILMKNVLDKTWLLMVTQYRWQIYWGKPDKCLYSEHFGSGEFFVLSNQRQKYDILWIILLGFFTWLNLREVSRYIWNITELLNLVQDYIVRIKSKLQENQTKITFFLLWNKHNDFYTQNSSVKSTILYQTVKDMYVCTRKNPTSMVRTKK